MLKRLIKIVIAYVWKGYLVIVNSMKSNGYGGRKRLTVLTYHGVKDYERTAFELQMRQLPRYGKPVPVDTNTEEMETGNNIAVTFDDGYANLVENALPSLKEEGIPATIFITAGHLGRNAEWAAMETSNRQELILNEDQVRAVWRSGINIGSHGLTHRDLSILDDESAYLELIESRRKLENCLGRPIDLFAFPFGAYDDRVVQMAVRAGYRLVFRNIPSPDSIKTTDILRGRISIEPTDWSLEYRLKMAGAYEWLYYMIPIKTKIKSFWKNPILNIKWMPY